MLSPESKKNIAEAFMECPVTVDFDSLIPPRPDLDAQIAATAVVHNMTVLTRNISDMEYTGAEVENPF